jgi:hypothetical protein
MIPRTPFLGYKTLDFALRAVNPPRFAHISGVKTIKHPPQPAIPKADDHFARDSFELTGEKNYI